MMQPNDVIHEIEEQKRMWPRSKYVHLDPEETEYIMTALKKLIPVMPVRAGYNGHAWECGDCHAIVGIVGDDKRDLYCRSCGRPVNWDA